MNHNPENLILFHILISALIVGIASLICSFFLKRWKKESLYHLRRSMMPGEKYCFEGRKDRFHLFIGLLGVSLLSPFTFAIPLLGFLKGNPIGNNYWARSGYFLLFFNVLFVLLLVSYALSELIVTNRNIYVRRMRSFWQRRKIPLSDVYNVICQSVPKFGYRTRIKCNVNSTIYFACMHDFKDKLEPLLISLPSEVSQKSVSPHPATEKHNMQSGRYLSSRTSKCPVCDRTVSNITVAKLFFLTKHTLFVCDHCKADLKADKKSVEDYSKWPHALSIAITLMIFLFVQFKFLPLGLGIVFSFSALFICFVFLMQSLIDLKGVVDEKQVGFVLLNRQ